jgi:hypothetical protein
MSIFVIICPPIAIVYIGSYYVMNMTHATNIWMFLLLMLGVFMKYGNKSHIEMGPSTLLIVGISQRW